MLISIFIPTSNRAKSLQRVLTSLTKQSYKKFEVLIVDYKSTDTIVQVIGNFRNSLHRIEYIKQVERGLTKAANLALSHAKGEIFIRTDDDVIMKPYWLETIYKTFKESKKNENRKDTEKYKKKY